MELFNDFILFELVENYLIIEYEDILPELILDIWCICQLNFGPLIS